MNGPAATVLLTSTFSDAHTWNLVYLQLVCEERGHRVVNLGACVPIELLLDSWREHDPDVVVVSSVNGHGYVDGLDIATAAGRHPDLRRTPMVIGGMLTTDGGADGTVGIGPARRHRLTAAGYALVCDDGDTTAFSALLSRVAGARVGS